MPLPPPPPFLLYLILSAPLPAAIINRLISEIWLLLDYRFSWWWREQQQQVPSTWRANRQTNAAVMACRSAGGGGLNVVGVHPVGGGSRGVQRLLLLLLTASLLPQYTVSDFRVVKGGSKISFKIIMNVK